MNTYLFVVLLIVLCLLHAFAGGDIWTFNTLIGVFVLCQIDARMDVQKIAKQMELVQVKADTLDAYTMSIKYRRSDDYAAMRSIFERIRDAANRADK